MKVIIADDEPLARELLRRLLADAPDVEVVGEASNGEELMAQARTSGADLILTDIDMPGVDGLKAAFALSHLGGPDVVFVTAYERHATAAFDIDAVDYVLKPVRRHRLQEALERARRRRQARIALAEPQAAATVATAANSDCLWVSTRRGLVRVDLANIQRIEAAGDHIYLHTAEKSWLHRMTMSKFETLNTGGDLKRIHRSVFVRLSLIRAIDRRGRNLCVTLADGATAPVGPNYRHVLPRHPEG